MPLAFSGHIRIAPPVCQRLHPCLTVIAAVQGHRDGFEGAPPVLWGVYNPPSQRGKCGVRLPPRVWRAPPTVAWPPRWWPDGPHGGLTRRAVHRLDGCPTRPPPLRLAGTPGSPRPQSPLGGAPPPSSYTRNSSLCVARHSLGFLCHPSIRCPT